MPLDKDQIAHLYSKRARNYDLTANLYYLIGFREQAYRELAVTALGLRRGDCVVELGCGTGLNFPLLQDRIGPDGKIIGVDLTQEMLDQARDRVDRNGWQNVDLVHQDVAQYRFPEGTDGILTTFALSLVAEYDRVIQRGAGALGNGKRMVILDLTLPQNWPRWVIDFAVFITRPFGATYDIADRRPWESLERHFLHSKFKRLYLGFAYLSVGKSIE